MASDQVSKTAAGETPEEKIAKQVADKIWTECQSGASCKDKATVSTKVNADLDQAGKDNPGANAFLIAIDLDREVSSRQTAMLAAAKSKDGKAGLREATGSIEYNFAGSIHSIALKRADHLDPPKGWTPAPPCKCKPL